MVKMVIEGTVLIGSKTIDRYILACLTIFHEGKNEIIIMARGKNISKAVDVVERLRRYYMRDVKIDKIELGSEILPDAHGAPRRISTITIKLSKGG